MTEASTLQSPLNQARETCVAPEKEVEEATVEQSEEESDLGSGSESSASKDQVGEDPAQSQRPGFENDQDPADFGEEQFWASLVCNVLMPLARQLEYYLSASNLSKDTYVQTLRDLNDGCVPVSIIARFAKIQTIMPMSLADEDARIHALILAATDYSDLLQICAIDTSTGKKVEMPNVLNSETSSVSSMPGNPKNVILALGTVTGEPITLQDCHVAALSPPDQHRRGDDQSTGSGASGSDNTIILREVGPRVTADEVRSVLESDESCPPIISIQNDVSHCWFVTLDTQDRDDLVRLLMRLRTKTLGGEVILARIKASSLGVSPPFSSSTGNLMTSVQNLAITTRNANTADTRLLQAYMLYLTPSKDPQQEGAKKKKKRVRGKRRKKNKQLHQQQTVGGKSSQQEGTVTQPRQNPSFREEDFPSLNACDEYDKKVEWETSLVPVEHRENEDADSLEEVDEEDDGGTGESTLKSTKTANNSDGASTATTTSSSLESLPKKSNYAAALLATPRAEMGVNVVNSAPAVFKVAEPSRPSPPTGNVVKGAVPDAAWGNIRSFADIVKRENP